MSGVASIVEANITQKTWDDVTTMVPYVVAGLFLACLFIRECNLMSLEDKTVRSLGMNVNATRIVISLIAVLLASISTAIAGAVSFLGLIVPHIGRILVGSDHRALIPFSALSGACFFLLADTIGRTIAAPYEISAAIIMSVVGGPFFHYSFYGGRENMQTENRDLKPEKMAMTVKDVSFFLWEKPDFKRCFSGNSKRKDHYDPGCKRLWKINVIFVDDKESES